MVRQKKLTQVNKNKILRREALTWNRAIRKSSEAFVLDYFYCFCKAVLQDVFSIRFFGDNSILFSKFRPMTEEIDDVSHNFLY